MTPQEKKELRDKILKDQGKMTNPFLKFNKLGQPYMEAKKGGSAKKFPDLFKVLSPSQNGIETFSSNIKKFIDDLNRNLSASEITFNESHEDIDVRIEGDTDTDLFFTNAGTKQKFIKSCATF